MHYFDMTPSKLAAEYERLEKLSKVAPTIKQRMEAMRNIHLIKIELGIKIGKK